MKVIDFFESDQQERWLAQIGESDWDAGDFLCRMLKDGTVFDFIGEGSKVLLLVDGDALISYCTFAQRDDIPQTDLTPWVGFVYTFPEYRGNRYIGLLFEEADRLAREAHFSEFYISTNHIGLYEKYGCTFKMLAKDFEGQWSRIYTRKVSCGAERGNTQTSRRGAGTVTEKAIAYAEELFKGNSGGHDAAHTLRVYHNAMRIAEAESGCDQELVALAALLHDADDRKLFRTQNNANARSFLTANGVSPDRIEKICAVINAVSFSENRGRVPATLEGRIVQDADRLDAMGAVGIARTFAFGGQHGRPLAESVQHFYDKLLHLKDGMQTKTAKTIAAQRHAYLEAFLQELDKELQGR